MLRELLSMRVSSQVARTSALAPAVVSMLTSLARAETEAIRVEYQGVEGCPSSSEFLRQVSRRTSSARIATESESARTFVIVIERAPAGLVGSLVIRETNGTTVARKVTGSSCQDVAGVLALATALAIDPNAALAPDGLEAPEDAPEVRDPEPPVRAPEPVMAKPPKAAVTQEEEPFWYGMALGPSLMGLVAPRVSVGGSLAVRAYRVDRAPLSSFGITVSFLKALDSRLGSAIISHQFVFARPEACLISLGAHDGLAVMPCVGAELGTVKASGSNLAVEETRTRFWATADGILRLYLVPADAWFAELDLSLLVPITRYSFIVRDPITQVHAVPAIAGAASGLLGFRF
jgi:hypothetical protein